MMVIVFELSTLKKKIYYYNIILKAKWEGCMTLFCWSDATNPGNKLFLLFSSGTNLTENLLVKFISRLVVEPWTLAEVIVIF